MEVVAHPWMALQGSLALPEGLQVEVLAGGWMSTARVCMG
jgi:hypothetical protein